MIIAVDGPAASGKGTIAKALARHYGLPHLDTGLLYRAVALNLLRFGGDPESEFAAAFAGGKTRTAGLGELRFKESDRLTAMAEGLRTIGAEVEDLPDGLAIAGTGGEPLPGGARIDPSLDHRVAMGFAVAGLHSQQPVTVADMSAADTSFPGFARLLEELVH